MPDGQLDDLLFDFNQRFVGEALGNRRQIPSSPQSLSPKKQAYTRKTDSDMPPTTTICFGYIPDFFQLIVAMSACFVLS
jgi:hypothetical protein